MDGIPQETKKLVKLDVSLCEELGNELADGLFQTQGDGRARLILTNDGGFIRQVGRGTRLESVLDVQDKAGEWEPDLDNAAAGFLPDLEQCQVWSIDVSNDERKHKLLDMVDISSSLDPG